MLKITAPFKKKEEVVPLIKAGADELYCGYLSHEWEKRFTSLEFERKGGGSNFTDIEELKQAVTLAHKNGTPVYLALNGLYVNEQYPLLLKIVRDLDKADLDGYIVADIGLLISLRQSGYKKQVHISTGGTVFNSESAQFFRNMGACRIILDRQVTLSQMDELSTRNPYIDFEVFILNTLCVYIDGFCTFMHAYDKHPEGDIHQREWREKEALNVRSTYDAKAQEDACRLKYSIRVFQDKTGKKIDPNKIQPRFYKQLSDAVECGACALYDINKTKIKSVKIVGRQINSEARLRDTGFIRNALDILEQEKEITRKAFILRVQELYRKRYDYKGKCRGNNCYHPGVLLLKS